MREDWIEIGFKDIVDKIATSNYKVKQKDYLSAGDFPIIDQGQELIGGYENDEKKVLECDLPLVVFGDHTRCVKFINFQFIPGADGIKVLLPKIFIAPKFLYYVVNILANKIENKGYARHYQLLEKQLIGLPPLPEQRAIVKKLESLFSSLDAGVADLKKAQQQLKIYRQAVLKKAFEGDWNIVKLKQVSEDISYGYTESSTLEEVGPKFLRITDIQEDRVNWSIVPYCKCPDNQVAKYRLKNGDLVFARTGATVGKSYLVKDLQGTAIFASYLIRVRFVEAIVIDEFVKYFFKTTEYWKQITEGQVGIGQPNVNGSKLKELNIPLPTLVQQQQIVKEVESRLSVCDSIEQNIKASLEKAEALRQSILKKAFEGKLLTAQELAECKQAADYEPASVLLERIKVEHSKVSKPKKKTKTT